MSCSPPDAESGRRCQVWVVAVLPMLRPFRVATVAQCVERRGRSVPLLVVDPSITVGARVELGERP